MIKKVVGFSFYPWFIKEMSGYDTVLDLGAGSFNHLGEIGAKVKIGIESFQPYIDNAVFKDCHMICGNMIHYRDLTMDLWEGRKAVMLIDALEHIPMPFAMKLVKELKEDFDKILIMSPRGYDYQDKDVTGLGNDEGQTHKSFWFDEDMEKLNMTEVLVDEDYHRNEHPFPDKGCYFAVWNKKTFPGILSAIIVDDDYFDLMYKDDVLRAFFDYQDQFIRQ